VTVTRTIHFTDSGETREVTRACKVCGLTQEDLDDSPFQLVVSPQGVAHYTDCYGKTECGKDATRDGWWWPW
jgi:hypothetical protein